MKQNPKKGLRRDDFVKSVRPDPKSTEELVVLQGYIGNSNLDGHVRIYFDAMLSDCIELPEQDILHYNPVDTSEDSLGGSRLWVKKTTVFTAGDPSHANRIKSSFLEGDLIKAFGNQGGKVPRAIGRIVDINSNFLVGGCPFTGRFDNCAPTGVNDPICNLVQPQPPFTLGDTCNYTCRYNPCTRNPAFCPTFNPNPLAVCQIQTNPNDKTCELVAFREANLPNPQPGTQPYAGQFNPYGL